MGYGDTGYERQNLQYGTGETRPVNPPAIVGGEIAISDDISYPLSDFVKNVPSDGTFSIELRDDQGTSIKTVASGIDTTDGQYLSFSYQDYQDAVDNESAFVALPVGQIVEASLVSILDDTDEEKHVSLTMVPEVDCYDAFLEGSITSYFPSAPEMVTVDKFLSDGDAGFSDFQLSSNGTTWVAGDVGILAPEGMQAPIDIWIRALSPCPSSEFQTQIEGGPS